MTAATPPGEGLKACPAGHDKPLVGTTLDGGCYAMCRQDDCFWMAGYMATEAEAITAWNTRAADKRGEVVDRMQGHLRRVIAHATGGQIQNGDEYGLNDICVAITAFRNTVFQKGKDSAAPSAPTPANLGDALAFVERVARLSLVDEMEDEESSQNASERSADEFDNIIRQARDLSPRYREGNPA